MRVINISGETGVGTTSLGIQAAYTTALEGHKVLFVNTEMSDKWLGERLLDLKESFNGADFKGSLESSNINDVDVLQDILDEAFYDLVIVDNLQDIKAWDQLFTDQDNNKLLVLIHRVNKRELV